MFETSAMFTTYTEERPRLLANKIGDNERNRKEISNLLFCDNSVALADDTISRDELTTSPATAIGDICPQACDYVSTNVLPIINDFLNTPHRQLRNDYLWTNNSCEIWRTS